MVRKSGAVDIATLQETFKVSAITARRDLSILARQGRLRRARGGAVLPAVARHEDSFAARVARGSEAKRRLAQAALGLFEPGQTLFVDSSSSTYMFVEAAVSAGLRLTILTNSVPVITRLAASDVLDMDVICIGGELRRLGQSLVGPHAVNMVRAHAADATLVSSKGLLTDGDLVDPDAAESAIKRAMFARGGRRVVLIDGTKFDQTELHVFGHP